MAQIRSLGDLYLVDLDGNCVYSVNKAADFGTNFIAGPYRGTGLGKLIAATLDSGGSREVRLAESQPYEPNFGEAAMFMATPVRDSRGNPIGAVAIQLSMDLVGDILTDRTGLGESGEMYLVDGDDRAVSARRQAAAGVRNMGLDHEGVRGARSGKPFEYQRTNQAGEELLGLAVPIQQFGNTWVVIGEMTLGEILAPVHVARAALTKSAMMVLGMVLRVGGPRGAVDRSTDVTQSYAAYRRRLRATT